MTTQRLSRACHGAIAAAVLIGLTAAVIAAEPADLACKQQPGNRFFWLERAFCDLPMHGPERANGVVLWNHGMSGTRESWMSPAPPAFRLLQRRGWDVVMLKRHHLAETENALYRTVERTLHDAAAFRKAGYRKVVLAGQSFGGYATLEAIDTASGIDAAVAFAPGVRPGGGSGRLDASIIERILQRATVGRLALVFPKDDALFGYQERGGRANAILAGRTVPYLLLDETSGLSGHGGAMTGRFALRYGLCLADFLAAPSIRSGRFSCPPVTDEWSLVRELLLPASMDGVTLIRDPSKWPEPVGSLVGLRWAMLDDTIVLIAPVASEPGKLGLMYRSTGFGGGVFDAAVNDGVIRAVLSNKSTVTLKPAQGGTITWTAADGSRSLDAPLNAGRDDP